MFVRILNKLFFLNIAISIIFLPHVNALNETDLYQKENDFNNSFAKEICSTFQKYTNFNPYNFKEWEQKGNSDTVLLTLSGETNSIELRKYYLDTTINIYCNSIILSNNKEDNLWNNTRMLFLKGTIVKQYYDDSLGYIPNSNDELGLPNNDFKKWMDNNKLFVEEQIHTYLMPPLKIRKLMTMSVPPLREEKFYSTYNDYEDGHFPIYGGLTYGDGSDQITNFKLEGEIRKMLSFRENISIDKIADKYNETIFNKGMELWKLEKGYIGSQDEVIKSMANNERKILEGAYLSLIREVRKNGFPINKITSFYGKYPESNYLSPVYDKEPYDIYLHERNLLDYIYEYTIWMVLGLVVLLVLVGKIFLFYMNKKGGNQIKIKPKNIHITQREDKWNNISIGWKILLFIGGLLMPPLLIGIGSLLVLPDPIIIKNPWIDCILIFGLIKSSFTRKYNHFITVGILIMFIWYLIILIFITH